MQLVSNRTYHHPRSISANWRQLASAVRPNAVSPCDFHRSIETSCRQLDPNCPATSSILVDEECCAVSIGYPSSIEAPTIRFPTYLSSNASVVDSAGRGRPMWPSATTYDTDRDTPIGGATKKFAAQCLRHSDSYAVLALQNTHKCWLSICFVSLIKTKQSPLRFVQYIDTASIQLRPKKWIEFIRSCVCCLPQTRKRLFTKIVGSHISAL